MVNEFIKSLGLILPMTVIIMILEAVASKHMQGSQNSALAGTMSSFLIIRLGVRIHCNIRVPQDRSPLAGKSGPNVSLDSAGLRSCLHYPGCSFPYHDQGGLGRSCDVDHHELRVGDRVWCLFATDPECHKVKGYIGSDIANGDKCTAPFS